MLLLINFIYQSEYFHRLSKAPVIDAIEGQHLVDEYGDTALSLTMYCIINGVSKVTTNDSITYNTVEHQQ